MKRGANSCLQKTVFAFLFVGYVLFVVAFFIPRWFQFTQTGTGKQYNYGIFMACIRDDDGSSRCQYTHFKNVEGIITISWLDTQWQIMFLFWDMRRATFMLVERIFFTIVIFIWIDMGFPKCAWKAKMTLYGIIDICYKKDSSITSEYHYIVYDRIYLFYHQCHI